MQMQSDFDRLGGGDKLRVIIEDFVDRVVGDTMIGFHFRGVDMARLKTREWQLSARLLGADVVYEGRSVREAHARHPILGGQFMRRQQILKETLTDHDVETAVIDRWLAHNESMRGMVTGDEGSECDGEAASAEVAAVRSRTD
jgi:hemoglobin